MLVLMDPISMAAGAVIAAMGGEITKTALVPVTAWREHQTEKIKKRLDRTVHAIEHAAHGRDYQPSDRVAFKALAEAAVTDDELVADYLGGVIAASGAEDDSGVPVVARIGRMSALQLRIHYVIYRAVRELLSGSEINLHIAQDCPTIGISRSDLVVVLGDPSIGNRVAGEMYGLRAEGLITDGKYGPLKGEPEESEYYLQGKVTSLGAELFLWGHGARPVMANHIFQPGLVLSLLTEVPACPSAQVAA